MNPLTHTHFQYKLFPHSLSFHKSFLKPQVILSFQKYERERGEPREEQEAANKLKGKLPQHSLIKNLAKAELSLSLSLSLVERGTLLDCDDSCSLIRFLTGCLVG